MKKSQAENIKNALPSLITNLSGYFKSLFSLDKQKDNITNAGGSIGFLISLFGKPLIDNYFNKLSAKRLDHDGFYTYCKAAFKQATSSLQKLPNDDYSAPAYDIPALLVEQKFNSTIGSIEKTFSILIFQPRYHPAVGVVKSLFIEMLKSLSVKDDDIKLFLKDFNDNIEKSVEDEFGDDYEKHKENAKEKWLNYNETRLLIDLISYKRIGFVDEEDLKYEPAYGSWVPISQKTSSDENEDKEKISENEKKLYPVAQLVEDYFNIKPENHLEKILFLIADFGKGKSVFLKNYATELAQIYLETGEGYFPVYFNLRNFSRYNSDVQLGVIDDFLQTSYAIKLTSDHFTKKKYIFLIDSLDESCDLSKTEVRKVLSSIKRIQNLDKTTCRENKIIITSRPFDSSLFEYIYEHEPYVTTFEGKHIPTYLSLYGFKKEQFNDWIHSSIKSIFKTLDTEHSDGYIKELLNSVKKNDVLNIYDILLDAGTLKSSELRRPIFAYMIYQLIKNNVNVTLTGKIGIYLSFLNLLSKEAKYIHDPNVKIRIQEQFEARSILHHIASLWIYERQQGKQGALKKADLCRIVGNLGAEVSDTEVIEKYKKMGGSDIQFLSHSYFGENDNVLHFQHQSFAEILLAEYYIKVLIKCALEPSTDIEFAISKLQLGVPTDQTIEFFREILLLLKESASTTLTKELIEKRKLLIPFLASISNVANNKTLNSQDLYYKWYAQAGITNETLETPDYLYKNWCINQSVIDKIVSLCEDIITSTKEYVLSKSKPITSLIDNEITYLHNSNFNISQNIDKSLALIAGNLLYNDGEKYFIRKFSPYITIPLCEKLKFGWNNEDFKGIVVENYPFADFRCSQINFSNAVFKNCLFIHCHFIGCKFSDILFEDVTFYQSKMNLCDIYGQLKGNIRINDLQFDTTLFMPLEISIKVFNYSKKIKPKETSKTNESFDIFNFFSYENFLPSFFDYKVFIENTSSCERVLEKFTFYFKYCLENKILTEKEIANAFLFKTAELKRFMIKELKSITNSKNKPTHNIITK